MFSFNISSFTGVCRLCSDVGFRLEGACGRGLLGDGAGRGVRRLEAHDLAGGASLGIGPEQSEMRGGESARLVRWSGVLMDQAWRTLNGPRSWVCRAIRYQASTCTRILGP